jgi:hypothetical protein
VFGGVVTSPFGKLVLILIQVEVQEFMVHLTEEDRPFATTRATRVVIVKNKEFPALFAGCGEKIFTGGLEPFEDF